jgi:3-oxoacyl-[acyl-carrier protein] reductase
LQRAAIFVPGEESLSTLEGKTVLVSGGSRGIGSEIVRALAAAKAHVAFTYQQGEAAAESLVKELTHAGSKVIALRCDSRDLKAARSTVEQVSKTLGPISGLVNNAGITRDKPFVMMSEEEWKDVIDTDLTGVFNFCRAVVFSMMKKKTGKIVNIGSVSGIIGNRGQVNYSAAKAGVVGLTKALAKETAAYGITVNVVAPGYIDTEMVRRLPEETLKEAIGYIPAGRLGTSREVASLVRYLLTDDANYITGQVFTIAGGLAI